LNREKGFGALSYGVADPSIFATNGGPSIAEMMLVEGCAWFRGDNARQPGWEQVRKRLAADPPLLLFHESCEHTIRTLPALQHDERNSEDLDTDAEDHAADETRYAVMSRPMTAEAKKTRPGINWSVAQAMPTVNQIIAENKRRRLKAMEGAY
jgi:hypothetical protein